MRRFSLYKRGSIWYAQIFNPTMHKYLPGKPTGESDRRAAEHVAEDWLQNGIPATNGKRRAMDDMLRIAAVLDEIRKVTLNSDDAQRIVHILKDKQLIDTVVVKAGPGTEALVAFLRRFWDFENSPYVRDKLAHGQLIGRRHCYDMALHIKTHWDPYFGTNKRMAELQKAELRDFSLWLAEEKHLAPKTINHVMSAGTVPLRWAFESELIAANPAQGLLRFSGPSAKRGVLTEEEVKKLFETKWGDERARVGNELAMSTGLRAGEVLASQIRDIGDDRLRIGHSWSNFDGLKGTKTNKERFVPLIPSVRAELLRLARENPHGAGPTTFIFWSAEMPDRPMDFHFLLDGLKDALVRMTLTEEELKNAEKVLAARDNWKSRKVSFHSWRHYFAARMADRLEKRKVMLATGHANGAVFEAYADHATEETFQEVAEAAQAAFGNLISFRM